jgi:hypothetical protein
LSFEPRRAIAVLAVILGVGIAAWALFARKSDEEQIRERLDRLAHVAGVEAPDENPIFRGKRMQNEFQVLFTPSVRVDISELGSMGEGRDGLVAAATRAGNLYRTAEIEIKPERVQIVEGSNAATVQATAVLTGDRGQGPVKDQRRVSFGFAKTKDGWQIDSVVVTADDASE